MESEPIKDEKKKGVDSGWRWLLWWQISPEELEGQVENYNTLKITKSARGLSFLYCILGSIITLICIVFFNLDKMSFFDIALFLIFGFFIYKGQRWAIIFVMILWTTDKAYMVYESIDKGTQPFLQIVWWCLFMHAFYVALKVENSRRLILRKK